MISQTGWRLEDFPVETNGQALGEAIRRIPGLEHLVFEEGLESAWLYETLRPHVDEVIVAGVTESRRHKSDKRDADGLAEKLRTGSLDEQVDFFREQKKRIEADLLQESRKHEIVQMEGWFSRSREEPRCYENAQHED